MPIDQNHNNAQLIRNRELHLLQVSEEHVMQMNQFDWRIQMTLFEMNMYHKVDNVPSRVEQEQAKYIGCYYLVPTSQNKVHHNHHHVVKIHLCWDFCFEKIYVLNKRKIFNILKEKWYEKLKVANIDEIVNLNYFTFTSSTDIEGTPDNVQFTLLFLIFKRKFQEKSFPGKNLLNLLTFETCTSFSNLHFKIYQITQQLLL